VNAGDVVATATSSANSRRRDKLRDDGARASMMGFSLVSSASGKRDRPLAPGSSTGSSGVDLTLAVFKQPGNADPGSREGSRL
jgi:hypothetical protein